MSTPYFFGQTLDDVMRIVIKEILARGARIKPTKGWTTEITGVLLEVTNTRARLSRSETRGKPFSCLGELCWYLAGSSDLAFITYYLQRYEDYAEDDEIFGAYGPRLFDRRGQNQVANVTNLLRRNRASRRAVIQLFDAKDIVGEHKDVPCTCTLQFMIRDDKLDMFTNMRSNDVFWGLPHDVFCFTMLQEIIARDLSLDVGTYKHAVGSLHLYDPHLEGAKRYLGEGWQSTTPMPSMPAGSPWQDIGTFLEAEAEIRTKGSFDDQKLEKLDAYWGDLIRLLEVFRAAKRDRDVRKVIAIRQSMVSQVYATFIDKLLSELNA